MCYNISISLPDEKCKYKRGLTFCVGFKWTFKISGPNEYI